MDYLIQIEEGHRTDSGTTTFKGNECRTGGSRKGDSEEAAPEQEEIQESSISC